MGDLEECKVCVSFIYKLYICSRNPCREPAPEVVQRLQEGRYVVRAAPRAVLCQRLSAWPWGNHEDPQPHLHRSTADYA